MSRSENILGTVGNIPVVRIEAFNPLAEEELVISRSTPATRFGA